MVRSRPAYLPIRPFAYSPIRPFAHSLVRLQPLTHILLQLRTSSAPLPRRGSYCIRFSWAGCCAQYMSRHHGFYDLLKWRVRSLLWLLLRCCLRCTGGLGKQAQGASLRQHQLFWPLVSEKIKVLPPAFEALSERGLSKPKAFIMTATTFMCGILLLSLAMCCRTMGQLGAVPPANTGARCGISAGTRRCWRNCFLPLWARCAPPQHWIYQSSTPHSLTPGPLCLVFLHQQRQPDGKMNRSPFRSLARASIAETRSWSPSPALGGTWIATGSGCFSPCLFVLSDHRS